MHYVENNLSNSFNLPIDIKNRVNYYTKQVHEIKTDGIDFNKRLKIYETEKYRGTKHTKHQCF